MQAGADDVRVDEVGSIEVLGQPKDFSELKKSLVLHNLNPIFAEVTMRAENEIKLSGSTALQIQKLLDVIEAIDDVQNVYTNFVINQVILNVFH